MWFFKRSSQARSSPGHGRLYKSAGKFVPSVTTEYLPKEAEIKEPKDRDRDSDPGHATNS